jgi:hypothetical protein
LTIGLFFELLLPIAHLVSSNISEKPVSTHFSNLQIKCTKITHRGFVW